MTVRCHFKITKFSISSLSKDMENILLYVFNILLIIKCRLFLIFKRRFQIRAIKGDDSKCSNTEGQEIKPLKFVTSFEPQIL